jgi:hypothetical protein
MFYILVNEDGSNVKVNLFYYIYKLKIYIKYIKNKKK